MIHGVGTRTIFKKYICNGISSINYLLNFQDVTGNYGQCMKSEILQAKDSTKIKELFRAAFISKVQNSLYCKLKRLYHDHSAYTVKYYKPTQLLVH
jgi:hypothetical protein